MKKDTISELCRIYAYNSSHQYAALGARDPAFEPHDWVRQAIEAYGDVITNNLREKFNANLKEAQAKTRIAEAEVETMREAGLKSLDANLAAAAENNRLNFELEQLATKCEAMKLELANAKLAAEEQTKVENKLRANLAEGLRVETERDEWKKKLARVEEQLATALKKVDELHLVERERNDALAKCVQLAGALEAELPPEAKPHVLETADASYTAGEEARVRDINARRERILSALTAGRSTSDAWYVGAADCNDGVAHVPSDRPVIGRITCLRCNRVIG